MTPGGHMLYGIAYAPSMCAGITIGCELTRGSDLVGASPVPSAAGVLVTSSDRRSVAEPCAEPCVLN